jgi:hypothetical protein
VLAIKGAQQSSDSITDAQSEDADDGGRLAPPQDGCQTNDNTIGHRALQQLLPIASSTHKSYSVGVLS